MKNKTVEYEVLKAYADCTDSNFERASKIRNLNFLASQFVPRDEAVRILIKAMPGGYNDFKAEKLLELPENCEVQIAREGSVALYVKGNCHLPQDFGEENHNTGGVMRYWWD